MDQVTVKEFSRKYLTELLIGVALVVAAFSSWMHYMFGPGWAIWFFVGGAILGIFFPTPIENTMKRFYRWISMQNKVGQLVSGIIHILVGLFLPFVLFGLFGLLSGTAYHYFTGRSLMSHSGKKVA